MTRDRICLAWSCLALLLAACSPKFDWREIRLADGADGGAFAVLLPGKPQTVTRDIAFDGRTVRMTIVSTGVGPTVFAAGVARLPAEAVVPSQIDATLAWFRDGLVRNIEGRAPTVAPAALSAAAVAGHTQRGGQAVDARGRIGARGEAGQLAARFYVVDDRLYQVVAMGADGELTPDALETFFSSFRLIKGGSHETR